MKYARSEKQRRSFLLPVLCGAMSVSQSGFRAWQAGGTRERERLTHGPGTGADPHDSPGGSAGIRSAAHPRRAERA